LVFQETVLNFSNLKKDSLMKTSFAKVAGGLALLAVSSVAMASVVNTKHNLGATNVAGFSNHTTATTEICIFCHTPHGGDQTTTAPIWNRATGTATYIRFSSLGRLTFDAKEAPIGAVSAACLSCHDGTQAMDAVINSSGSDSVYTQDTGAGNGSWSQGRAMGNGSFAGANGAWNGVNPARGDMVYLGTDLSNDHPISMQYGGGGISTTTPAGPTTDPDFAQAIGASKAGGGTVSGGNPGGLVINGGAGYPSNAGLNNTTSDNVGGVLTGVNGSGTGAIVHTTVAGADRWYVDTNGTGSAYVSTDFPLYTRTDVVGSATAQPTVECGTCHDPHSGNPTFLRLADGNTGSQVCLTCHAK
jgi:predicted CXXCH cytochrome family protein